MTQYRINPARDLIVAIPDKRPTETASGILLPESQEPATTGVVARVGPDVEGFQPGDRIVFARYGGSPIALDGVDFVVLPFDQVLGRLDPPEDEGAVRIREIVAEIEPGRLADMSDDDVAEYVRARMEGGDHVDA